jgi:secreted trypsin-like serine protease
VRIHQQYVKEDNFANDIAILRLARPIVLKAQVSPVCLPGINDDPTPGRSCYVTGWGLIGSGNAPFSNVLREGKVTIISRDLCRQGRLWGNSVKNTNICAGYLNGKVDACKVSPIFCF